MCGITGLIDKQKNPIDPIVIEKMTRTLVHRGPDAEGYFLKPGIALGHRRLSIIDLSGGTQPMTTPDGRYTIVFNGEIYNFEELKKELEKTGVRFQTHSDTEVLLQLYIQEGPDCLQKLNGMFAFAIWDHTHSELFAARDRMGKKPFYYWNTPRYFAFASEVKAILAHPDFVRDLDPEALAHYFQYEYVPAPYCIFKGVKKLPQAHTLRFKKDQLIIQRYWDIPLTNKKENISEKDAVKEILNKLDQAVECRLVADVPLGVFLSGGIDSSSIVALMAKHRAGKDIQTFAIGFKEASYDETRYSNLIAKKFGTDHHHQYLSASRMLEILPEIIDLMDEPFSDYSIIPTYLLSKFTRQTVTVALGGDGGDELFAGYPTFVADRLAKRYQAWPSLIKKIIRGFAHVLPTSEKDMSFEFKLRQFLYGVEYPPILRNQVWLGALNTKEQSQIFSEKTWNEIRNCNPLGLIREQMNSCQSTDPGDRLSYFYQKFYLCDDILVKADRASMAASLEVRAPYLDVNVVEFVSRLPFTYKLKGSQTKYLLKKSLEGILPKEILHRKKKGFGIPTNVWLKKELKDQMLKTLHPEKIRKAGIFRPEFVDRLISDHLSGKRNNRKSLFALLMFEGWREKFLG